MVESVLVKENYGERRSNWIVKLLRDMSNLSIEMKKEEQRHGWYSTLLGSWVLIGYGLFKLRVGSLT